MSNLLKNNSELDRIEREAAAWIVRRDRGLTAAETEEFDQWLAADPGHWVSFAHQRRTWDSLDQLAGMQLHRSAGANPDLLASPVRPIRWMWFSAIAAAAAVAVVAYVWWSYSSAFRASGLAIATAPIEERVLEDGSTIQLNRGAVVTVNFTPHERLVHLERGEANFTVAKDKTRPFIVAAGGVRGRAVGTIFDVRLEAMAVAVLVTEGRVEVDVSAVPGKEDSSKEQEPLSMATPVVEAGQRAIVSLGPSGPTTKVAAISADEIEQLLAWQPHLLDFTATPLSDIVAEFNRHNTMQLTIAEPELATLRISGSFRSDNLEGFVRLLEVSFGMRAERRGANLVALCQAR